MQPAMTPSISKILADSLFPGVDMDGKTLLPNGAGFRRDERSSE